MNCSQLHHRRRTSADQENRISVQPARINDRGHEAALIRSCQQGNKKAFDLLIRKYQRKVIGLVSRRIYDSSEALDVTQEVFVKAYRALPRFRGESAFYTWLYRIAINTVTNHLKFQERRRTLAGSHVIDIGWLEDALQPNDLGTPEHIFLTNDIQKRVIDAINHLPVVLKRAFTLRVLEGMSYEEIAQVAKCPIGTVRSRIFRAREAVNARLKPLLD